MGLNSGQTFRGTADLAPPTIPTIYNVPAPLAATEYSQTLSPATKQFLIKVRGIAQLQFSFVSGETATKFITVPRGTSYMQELVSYTGTIYFQVSAASQVVEILEWT